MKFKLLLPLLFFVWCASANTLDSLRSEKRGEQWFVIHEVEPGETLYAITRRYKADINAVIKHNSIQNNSIQVGQLLEVPVTMAGSAPAPSKSQIHTVAPGETLFAISRKYGVKVDEIVAWNNLTSEALAVGQELKIGKGAVQTSTPTNTTTKVAKEKEEEKVPFARAQKHYVQFGETLEQIADRRKVSMDSLRRWNSMTSNDLKIGQVLWYRTYAQPSNAPSTKREVYGKRIEEGVAMTIDEAEITDKYLALHRTIPVGTLVEVRNLMNNKKVYVRVVGNLPSTGLNDNVMIRLTAKSFERLGILDARARVEVTYYED